jgi:hypothetical protein
MTFQEFLATISWLMEQRQNPDDNTVDGHWDTQVPPAALSFEYDQVIDVSDLGRVLPALCAQYGLTHQAKAVNKTPYSGSSDKYLGTIPAHELAEVPVNKENFRSPETDLIIKNLYAVDYQKFGHQTAE